MRFYFLVQLLLLLTALQVKAQRECSSFPYQQHQLTAEPGLRYKITDIEEFIQKSSAGQTAGKLHAGPVYTIPVVVHILYNRPEENISIERIQSQIDVLNESFRRRNADTSKTPEAFKDIAADCGIEFRLAISDPQRRATSGIIRKYTPVASWKADDGMKFAAQGGSDAWDPENYLNIWVCNLGLVAGYSSFPGGPAAKDGIVISHNVFGKNKKSGYEMGKTAVHEAGHWMGLRHIWGDSYCGDDWVSDTPSQANFTAGCPTGIRPSCNNGPLGDMYMNYMDITADACVNLFTEGQKARMRSHFDKDGPRHRILASYGLQTPLFGEVPSQPEELPKWSSPQLYPNPATNEIILDLSNDIRWVSTELRIVNAQGQPMMQQVIGSKMVKLNIETLKPGIYILAAKRNDGATIKQKFIKM